MEINNNSTQPNIATENSTVVACQDTNVSTTDMGKIQRQIKILERQLAKETNPELIIDLKEWIDELKMEVNRTGKGHVNECGECPFFEWFLDEFKSGAGKKVGTGRCHKFNEDEVWETKTPCSFADQTSLEELKKMALDK